VALTDLPSSAQSPVPVVVAPQPSHPPSPRWVPQRLPLLRPVQRATKSAVKRSLASTRKSNNGLVVGVTRRSAISTGPSDISLPSVSRSPAVTAGVGSVPSSFPDVATSNGSLVRDKQSYEVSSSVTRTTPSLRSSNPPSRYLTAHSFIDACDRLLTSPTVPTPLYDFQLRDSHHACRVSNPPLRYAPHLYPLRAICSRPYCVRHVAINPCRILSARYRFGMVCMGPPAVASSRHLRSGVATKITTHFEILSGFSLTSVVICSCHRNT